MAENKKFSVATNGTPNKGERQPVEVTLEELNALLDAGLIRIVPEYDGKTPGTTYHSREEILRFIVERPDQVGGEAQERLKAAS